MPHGWKKRRKDTTSPSYIEERMLVDTDKSSPTLFYSAQRVSNINIGHMVGWDVPNFHARRRRGELIEMTPFTQVFITGENISGKYSVKFDTGNNHWTKYYLDDGAEYMWVYSTSWQLSVDVMNNYATDQGTLAYVQEAASRIYRNGHDTLTFLAELTDVRRLFVGTLKGLLKLNFPKNLRQLSCAWLATRYGWRTLIYDLQDLNKAVQNLGGSRTRYTESAGNTSSSVLFQEWETSIGAGTIQHSYTDKISVGLRGSVVADVDVPKFQFNPLQTGWEKLPFSFVLDWIVSVGAALSAFSFLCLDPKYTAAYGVAVTIEREYENYLSIPLPNVIEHDVGQTGRSSGTIQLRVPCKIPLSPQFVLKLNRWKVTDLLALLFQRLRR